MLHALVLSIAIASWITCVTLFVVYAADVLRTANRFLGSIRTKTNKEGK